jgi:hypothetical protein
MRRAPDPDSVVDPGDRVIGTANGFGADASMTPQMMRTDTNVPTILIVEKAAGMMR